MAVPRPNGRPTRTAGRPADGEACPVVELLERTRVARGLPLTIDDPAIIQKVARIVTLGGAA